MFSVPACALLAPQVAPARRAVITLTAAYNGTASRPVVIWSRDQQQSERVPGEQQPSWWLPTLLRRQGVWSGDSFSQDDAGSFALGLLFFGAAGFLFGAGEPSQYGMPILPSESRRATARGDGPRLVISDQASVRAGARSFGEQLERQRLLVKKDRTQLAALETALRLELGGLESRVSAWRDAQEQDAAEGRALRVASGVPEQREGAGGASSWKLWRETPDEYRQRLLQSINRRGERAAFLRLNLRAEEEVLAELQRLAAQRDPDAPPVQLGVFPDGQFQQSKGEVYYNTGWASPGL